MIPWDPFRKGEPEEHVVTPQSDVSQTPERVETTP